MDRADEAIYPILVRLLTTEIESALWAVEEEGPDGISRELEPTYIGVAASPHVYKGHGARVRRRKDGLIFVLNDGLRDEPPEEYTIIVHEQGSFGSNDRLTNYILRPGEFILVPQHVAVFYIEQLCSDD